MKRNLLLLLSALLFGGSSLFAQVQIDHSLQLTGSGANAKVSGIQNVSANQDAISVDYLQKGALVFAPDNSSTVNAYTVTLSPALSGSAYTAGMAVSFKANLANTGSATLNVNSFGAKTIFKNYNLSLVANDIQAGQIITVMYDGANWQMLSQLGNAPFPRMDSTQRNAIASPSQSLIIYNTSVGCMQIYNSFSFTWENMYCLSCNSAPPAPVAISPTGVVAQQFTANWNVSNGATSYVLDVATDSTFTTGFVVNNLNVGNVLSYNVTGLTSLNYYYYRVRAVSNCGTSGNSNKVVALTRNIVNGIVSYWKLDGNSQDAAGSNNGSDANISYSTSNGRVNQGARFNGTSSYILLGNLISGQVDLTLTAWIKATNTTDLAYVICQRDINNYDGEFALNLSSTDQFQFWDYQGSQGVGFSQSYYTPAIPDSNWHFFAFTKNGTTGTYYLDGIVIGTETAVYNNAYSSLPTGGIGVDSRNVNGNFGSDRNIFNGCLDEIGLWKRGLSALEISILYNNGAGLQYPF